MCSYMHCLLTKVQYYTYVFAKLKEVYFSYTLPSFALREGIR